MIVKRLEEIERDLLMAYARLNGLGDEFVNDNLGMISLKRRFAKCCLGCAVSYIRERGRMQS